MLVKNPWAFYFSFLDDQEYEEINLNHRIYPGKENVFTQIIKKATTLAICDITSSIYYIVTWDYIFKTIALKV